MQRGHLSKLAQEPETGIDTSDIPEASVALWKEGRRGVFYRPMKQQMTARLDTDVLSPILRREMLAMERRRG